MNKAILQRIFTMAIAMMISLSVWADVITGTVTDTSGEPLIGAAVRLKGSEVGVSTDIDGLYRIITVR